MQDKIHEGESESYVNVTTYYRQFLDTITEKRLQRVEIKSRYELTTVDVLRIVDNFVPLCGMELLTIKQKNQRQLVDASEYVHYERWMKWRPYAAITVDVIP